MSYLKLKEIINKKEGETTEFKSSYNDTNRLVEIVASFANSRGGHLLIGIDDDGNILGVEMKRGTIENLTNVITDNTDPVIYPKIDLIKVAGKSVIQVEVASSTQRPHLAYGRPFKRTGSVTKLMERAEYESELMERVKYEFDAQLCRKASLKDVDMGALSEYRRRCESHNGNRLLGSDIEILKSRQLVTDDGGITHAGILLFGKEPQRFIPKSYVTVVRYPDTKVTETILDSKDFRGNLFTIIDKTDEYLREHIQVISQIPKVGLERLDMPVYPFFVMRELLVNAVVHRDYALYGTRILIQLFKDRVEFYSPGGFPAGVNSENLREAQHSRNPLIARVLHDVKYLEEFGNGVDRIIEEVDNYPLKVKYPEWKDIGAAVVTTLYDPTYRAPAEEGNLNDRQKEVLEYLKTHPRITRREYVQIYNVTEVTAKRDLTALAQNGLVERKGSGSSVYYEMTRS